MCIGGGGGPQDVTTRTELDPALRRHLYGGTLANPRGGFGSDAAAAAPAAAPGTGAGVGGDNDADHDMYAGHSAGTPSDPTGIAGDNDNRGEVGGSYGAGDPGIGGGGFDPSGPGMGQGLYANGGMVMPPQQGIASLNQNRMPMMNGQMPNLSDPMTAATLAMAVRRPELQYGNVMSRPQANPMMANPMMARPAMNQMGYAMGGYVEGPGTGRSDSIPAKIYQDGVPVQEAALSDGEFVMTERAVKGAGDGDRRAGAARMYEMMKRFERGGRA